MIPFKIFHETHIDGATDRAICIASKTPCVARKWFLCEEQSRIRRPIPRFFLGGIIERSLKMCSFQQLLKHKWMYVKFIQAARVWSSLDFQFHFKNNFKEMYTGFSGRQFFEGASRKLLIKVVLSAQSSDSFRTEHMFPTQTFRMLGKFSVRAPD